MPRRFRRPTLIVVLVALLSVGAMGCAQRSSSGSGGGGASPVSRDLLAIVNQQRNAAGIPGLYWCPPLERSAQAHADDQAIHNTMTHTGSDGSNFMQRDERAGYNWWTSIGENVAYAAWSAAEVMSLWMNSPEHRANIMNPGFTHFGGGVGWASDGTTYWTQEFGASGSC